MQFSLDLTRYNGAINLPATCSTPASFGFSFSFYFYYWLYSHLADLIFECAGGTCHAVLRHAWQA